MIVYFLIFIFLIVISLRKVHLKAYNNDYLSQDNTKIVNGIFVLLVFFSHFFSYLNQLNYQDLLVKKAMDMLGQLMVSTFLFFSGYGIILKLESKNAREYVKSFTKHRFLPTYLNFAIAVSIYLIVDLILGFKYGIETIILSYTGYETIGNSNWYMFAIFCLYLFVLIAYNLLQKEKSVKPLILITLLSVAYIVIIGMLKGTWYSDTILCFVAGMWFGHFKEKIDVLLKKNKSYYLTLLSTIIIFVVLYIVNKKIGYSIYLNNFIAISFVLIICILLKKIEIKSKIFKFLGNNVFWIYILQRIPMIILNCKIDIYLEFPICLCITLLSATAMKLLTNKLWNKLLKE